MPEIIQEDSPVPSMLSEAQRPPADPSGATENLLMLAIQERLQSQLRPTANLFNHQLSLNQTITQDANRLFQQMLPLLGLPPLLPGLPNPLDLGCLPGTSMTHPLWQHNLCAWPECNHPCENLAVFLTHLSQAHTFNERWAPFFWNFVYFALLLMFHSALTCLTNGRQIIRYFFSW